MELNALVRRAATTTPLGGAATFTSSSFTTETGPGRTTALVVADQGGTLFIEQSGDNANWDLSSSWPLTAGTPLAVSIETIAEFGRVRYVNGAVAQTIFRLFVYGRRI